MSLSPSHFFLLYPTHVIIAFPFLPSLSHSCHYRLPSQTCRYITSKENTPCYLLRYLNVFCEVRSHLSRAPANMKLRFI
jgi:hypothetical protein